MPWNGLDLTKLTVTKISDSAFRVRNIMVQSIS